MLAMRLSFIVLQQSPTLLSLTPLSVACAASARTNMMCFHCKNRVAPKTLSSYNRQQKDPQDEDLCRAAKIGFSGSNSLCAEMQPKPLACNHKCVPSTASDHGEATVLLSTALSPRASWP